ncbi:MAG: hypothetical protein AAFY28_13035, partial [Actinomycetota bacterium]
MGLRKSAPEPAMAPPPPNPGGGGATALADPPVAPGSDAAVSDAGPAAAECAAVGDTLIAAGSIAADRFAEATAEAGGDLLKLGQLLLNRYGLARADLAQAVAAACSVDIAESNIGE